jgi:hypothetical protein
MILSGKLHHEWGINLWRLICLSFEFLICFWQRYSNYKIFFSLSYIF